MGLMERKRYPFTLEGVIQAPDKEGVYLIVSHNLDPIYVGRGNLRKRLTSHYHRKDLVDKCIWSNNPAHYYQEVCSDSEEREKKLLSKIPTSCNGRIS